VLIDAEVADPVEVAGLVMALIESPQVCSLKFLTCEQRSV